MAPSASRYVRRVVRQTSSDPSSMFTELSTAARRRVARYGQEAFCYSLRGLVSDESSAHVARDFGHAVESPPQLDVDLHKRTLLVTDAASDLPGAWRAEEGILLLPMKLRNREISRIDNGDTEPSIQFASKQVSQLAGQTHTLAPSVTTTSDLIEQRLREETDFVLQIAMSPMRSNCYANSLTAAQKLMVTCSRDRRRAGNTRPFKMWVVDSGASFNGHGLLIAESARLLRHNVPLPQVVQQIDALRRQVQTLIVPGQSARFHQGATLQGASLKHWLSCNVGPYFDRVPVAVAQAEDMYVMTTLRGLDTAINHAITQATHGVAQEQALSAPIVCVSYAGDVHDLRHVPAFSEFAGTCQRQDVLLLVSTMSMTNAVALGEGSLLISFASKHAIS